MPGKAHDLHLSTQRFEIVESLKLQRRDFAHGTGSDSRDRKWVVVLADRDRIGAQDKLDHFRIRHLALIEDVPFGARLTAGFGALQFSAPELDTSFLFQRTRVRSPLHIFFFVNVPVVAVTATEPQLPSIVWPRWRIRAAGGRIGKGKPDTRGAGCGTIG